MPALPAVSGGLRFDLHFAVGSDLLADSRVFFRYSGGPPALSDVTSFATSANASAAANLVPLLAPDRTYLGCKVTDLSSATGAVADVAANEPGTLTGTGLAPGTCTLTHYPISRRYRGGKPRTYWPFGDNTKLASTGLWTAAWVTNVQNSVNVFLEALRALASGSTNIQSQVNISYYHGFTSAQNPVTLRWRNIPTLRSTPLVDDIAAGAALADAVVASQRRRNKAA